MKRFVEITGLIAPLIVGALFALSGVVAPFGNAGDRMGPSFLIAMALALLSFAVGVHLSVRTKSSGAFGIFCGIAAGGILHIHLCRIQPSWGGWLLAGHDRYNYLSGSMRMVFSTSLNRKLLTASGPRATGQFRSSQKLKPMSAFAVLMPQAA